MCDNAKSIIHQCVNGDKDSSLLISILDPVWINSPHDSAILSTIIKLSTMGRPISASTISSRIAGVVGVEECKRMFTSQSAVESYIHACENECGWDISSCVEQIKLDYTKTNIQNATKLIIDALPTYESAADAASGSIEIIASNIDKSIGESGAHTQDEAVGSWIKSMKDMNVKSWDFPFPSWSKRANFKQSQIISFAAPSEAGKTWFGLSMLENICASGDNVAVFSGEMTPEELIDRLVCMGGISDTANTSAVMSRVEEIEKWNFTIYDGVITIDKIRAAVVRARAMGRPYDAVIVDHVHLMNFSGKDGYRIAMNDAMSVFKSEIANRERCGVILLAQLRKPPDSEINRRPRKSDIRESAAIENISDWIFLMARTNEDNVASTEAKIWNDKRRGGRGRLPTISVEISPVQNRLVEIDLGMIGRI